MATTLLTIGEFSRMTHLSVKALRHYHDVGVLAPAAIDGESGYRFYGTDQVTAAQVIRRLRDLGMPLDGIRSVLLAPDPAARNREIAVHLERMERQLAQTQAAVSGLRALLGGAGPQPVIGFRAIPAVTAFAVTAAVGWADAVAWGSDAFGELTTAAEEAGRPRSGPLGALFPGEFFELERGEVTAFVPVESGPVTPAPGGGVRLTKIPAIEAAVAVHDGPPGEADRTYGALGLVVAERSIGVDGPVREYYPDGFTPGPHRTEICWPVFRTGQQA